MSWMYFQEEWSLGHPVMFDGANKLIYLSPNVSSFNVKEDLYSNWKEWVMLHDYSKFLPAFRSIGGDPIGGGQYAGDLYFLTNGWQVVIGHPVTLSGVLYNDDQTKSPFIILPGGGIISTVSSLAYAYNTSGVTVPTTQEITQSVWGMNPAVMTDNTMGKKLMTAAEQTANIKVTTDTILAVSI